MTTLEKMAERLYAEDVAWTHGGGGVCLDIALPPWSAADARTRARFLNAARAALLAIREPDEAVEQAIRWGVTVDRHGDKDDGDQAWRDAIDAILSKKPQ